MLALKVPSVRVCMPSGVTVGQMMDIFLKNLRERPERRADPASYIVMASMMDAFPCAKD
jgi:hypothetical protein